MAALAELVGLDAGKAIEVANGWVPDEVDLSRWAKLRVITTAEGFEVNSFVVWDPKSRQAAVFDTGWFADDIFELAEIEDLKVEHHYHARRSCGGDGDVRKHQPDIRLHTIMRGPRRAVQEGRD